MNSFLLYLLKSTLILSVLYLAFSVLMRKENFFKINRMVLLLMVLSAALIPFLPSPQLIQPFRQATLEPIFQNPTVLEEPIQTTAVPENIQLADPVTETVKPFYLSPENILLFIYLAGAFVSLLLLLYSIASVLLLFRKARKTVQEGIPLMIVPKDMPAFSFCRTILISQHDYELHSQTIITHELSHIRMGHFYDLMLMELAKIIFWFNPLIYRMVNDLKEIHEFQADDHTLTSGIDATKYQLLIIQKSVGNQRFALANSFNHCQIKNRITMMNKQKTSKARSWKVATFFPLLAFLLMAFGKNSGNEPPDNSFQFKDQSFSIIQCEIANESFENTSKFEVDLFIEKQGNNLNKTSYEKNLIWLSIASKNVSELTDGEYHFSSDNPTKKAPMTFSGAIWVGNKKMDINAGDFMCSKQDSDKIKITFNLKVDEMDELKGNYSGSIRYVNRAINQNIPTSGPMQLTEIIDDSPIFSIEIRRDGNYIDNRLFTLEEIGKKAEVFHKSNENAVGSLKIDKEVPMERVTEIKQVLRKAKFMHIKYSSQNDSSNQQKMKENATGTGAQSEDKLKKGIALPPPPPPPTFKIEIRNDGNYIDNRLFTLEEINDEQLKSTNNQSDLVFLIVEEMPQFPGGDAALRNFIATNVKYPDEAQQKGIQGKVYVNFVVTKTGSIANAKVARGVDPLLEQEALRVVNLLPTWTPGKQKGENVAVSYTIPINFAIEKGANKEGTPAADPTVQKKKLFIVPNPTQSIATVTLEGSDSTNKLEVSIFSSYGKLISKETKNGPSFSLTVSNLTPGTYLVVATDGTTQYQGQMIVNH